MHACFCASPNILFSWSEIVNAYIKQVVEDSWFRYEVSGQFILKILLTAKELDALLTLFIVLDGQEHLLKDFKDRG